MIMNKVTLLYYYYIIFFFITRLADNRCTAVLGKMTDTFRTNEKMTHPYTY